MNTSSTEFRQILHNQGVTDNKTQRIEITSNDRGISLCTRNDDDNIETEVFIELYEGKLIVRAWNQNDMNADGGPTSKTILKRVK